MQRNGTIRRSACALAPLVLVLTGGCTSMKVTGTARTGTEQLLLTGTWDDALCRINFQPLAGARVFLDSSQIAVVDKGWVISSIRRTMAEQGVLLEDKKEKATLILEVAFGAYGTDQRDSRAGLPGLGLAPSTGGPAVVSNGSSTSLTFSQTNRQDAVVKAAMFAYEPKTGRLVWESGTILNAQGLRDHFLLGHGPYRMSSRSEVEQYPSESQTQTRKRFLQRLFGKD
jgi:hypothetical protein